LVAPASPLAGPSNLANAGARAGQITTSSGRSTAMPSAPDGATAASAPAGSAPRVPFGLPLLSPLLSGVILGTATGFAGLAILAYLGLLAPRPPSWRRLHPPAGLWRPLAFVEPLVPPG
jgi:hypothetical protein